jgi:hypothetical protein
MTRYTANYSRAKQGSWLKPLEQACLLQFCSSGGECSNTNQIGRRTTQGCFAAQLLCQPFVVRHFGACSKCKDISMFQKSFDQSNCALVNTQTVCMQKPNWLISDEGIIVFASTNSFPCTLLIEKHGKLSTCTHAAQSL